VRFLWGNTKWSTQNILGGENVELDIELAYFGHGTCLEVAMFDFEIRIPC